MQRDFNCDILQEIKDRWSPRAFCTGDVKKEDLMAMLEAARYSPSCHNEQPWKFIIVDEVNDKKKIMKSLSAQNQEWAKNVPVFLVLLSKKNYIYNGEENEWNKFDAGAAWAYLTLEAQRRGYITHGMAGFEPEVVRETYDINDDFDIVLVIAIGKYGDKNELSESFINREQPGIRKPVEDMILRF